MRVGEKEIWTGGHRRATRRSLHPRATRQPMRGGGGCRLGRARAARASATDLRGRHPRSPARRARGRSGERFALARVSWQGDELPLRTAQARLATTSAYDERDALGAAGLDRLRFVQRRTPSLLAAREELAADFGRAGPGAPQRSGEGHPVRPLLDAVAMARVETICRVHVVTGALGSTPARGGAERDAIICPRPLVATPVSARGHVHHAIGRFPFVKPRCAHSGSTSRRRRGFGSTSTTARRSRRAPA